MREGGRECVREREVSVSSTSSLVIQAANLPPMDANGLADPYVKLRMMPESSSSAKQKTDRQEKTLSPEWDETFF